MVTLRYHLRPQIHTGAMSLKRIKNELKKNSDFLSEDELVKVAKDCNSLYRLEKEPLEDVGLQNDLVPVPEIPTMSFRA